MSGLVKRILEKLGKKPKENSSVLGHEKFEKTEINVDNWNHSVLAYPLDVKPIDPSKLNESVLSRKLSKEEEEREYE